MRTTRRRILEIYTKTGNHAREFAHFENLAREGIIYCGIRIRGQLNQDLPSNVFLIPMKPRKLPFKDGVFEEIHLSYEARKKTKEKIEKEIEEAARVLKLNGSLIITGEENALSDNGESVSIIVIAAAIDVGLRVNGHLAEERLIKTALLELVQSEVDDNGKFMVVARKVE